MTVNVQASPVELSNLAGDVLTSSMDLGTALQTAQGSYPPVSAAFGDTTAASIVFERCESVCEQISETAEQLVTVLEGDVDLLYRAAFVLQARDQANGNDMCAVVPWAC